MDIQSGIFVFGLLWLMLWQFYESPFLGALLIAIATIMLYNIYHYININNTTIQTFRQEAQNFYQKILIMLDIFNNLNANASRVNRQVSTATHIHQYEHLSYIFQGNVYTMHVPYHENTVHTMTQLEVKVHFADGTTKEITHQPGIPYMVNAHEYNGSHIIVRHHDNDNEHRYEAHERPMFCREVMD